MSIKKTIFYECFFLSDDDQKNNISYVKFARLLRILFGQMLLMIAIVRAQMADVLNLILISFQKFLIIVLKNF